MQNIYSSLSVRQLLLSAIAEETRQRPVNGRRNSFRQETANLESAADWNHLGCRRPRLERRVRQPAQTYISAADRCALKTADMYAGPPCNRTEIYAARISRGSSSYRSISAARARPQQQTRRPLLLLPMHRADRRTARWTRPFYDAYSILNGFRNNRAVRTRPRVRSPVLRTGLRQLGHSIVV